MKRGLNWLFWGLIVSSFTINIFGIPISGPFWGALVVLRGLTLVRTARPNVPSQEVQRAATAAIVTALLMAAGMVLRTPLLAVAVFLCLTAQCEFMFAYLERSEGLFGHDPAQLHGQRRSALLLNAALCVCGAATLIFPGASVAAGVVSLASYLYQAWAMLQLGRTCDEPPQIPPADDE